MFIKDGIAHAGASVQGIRVADVRVVNDLSMLVTFSDGETRLFDASHLLGMPVFQSLADKRVSRAFRLIMALFAGSTVKSTSLWRPCTRIAMSIMDFKPRLLEL